VTERLLAKLYEMMQFGLLATLGGVANYLFVTIDKERPFSFWMLVANLLLAFYVGNQVGAFLPDSAYRDGFIMASGFATYPILSFMERRTARAIAAIGDAALGRLTGGSKHNPPEE
jgi:FtsH-binding integral membrane protein